MGGGKPLSGRIEAELNKVAYKPVAKRPMKIQKPTSISEERAKIKELEAALKASEAQVEENRRSYKESLASLTDKAKVTEEKWEADSTKLRLKTLSLMESEMRVNELKEENAELRKVVLKLPSHESLADARNTIKVLKRLVFTLPHRMKLVRQVRRLRMAGVRRVRRAMRVHKLVHSRLDGSTESVEPETPEPAPSQPSRSCEVRSTRVVFCSICSKGFTLNRRADAHVRAAHGTWDCTFHGCSKKFGSIIGLMDHFSTHSGKNARCCGECGFVFKRSGNSYKSHMGLHREWASSN